MRACVCVDFTTSRTSPYKSYIVHVHIVQLVILIKHILLCDGKCYIRRHTCVCCMVGYLQHSSCCSQFFSILVIDSNRFRYQLVPINTRDPTHCYVVNFFSSVLVCVRARMHSSTPLIILLYHRCLSFDSDLRESFTFASLFHVLSISSFFSSRPSVRARYNFISTTNYDLSCINTAYVSCSFFSSVSGFCVSLTKCQYANVFYVT